MAIRHLRDGEDFSAEHFPSDFGFTGSAKAERVTGAGRSAKMERNTGQPAGEHGGMPGYAHGGSEHPHGHDIRSSEPRADGAMVHHHRHGGMSIEHPDGRMTHHMHDGAEVMDHAMGGMQEPTHHMHPHGHRVERVEHNADGRIVMHHDHGGQTVHHPDGHISHHMEDGSPAAMMTGGVEGMHDSEGEYAHGGKMRGERGMMAEEKKMVKKGIREHEDHEHEGEHTDLHLARGGMPSGKIRMPRGMRPAAARTRSPIGGQKPDSMTTPRNNYAPSGQMGMGIEPSAEPDQAGSDQGIPQMHRGGKH